MRRSRLGVLKVSSFSFCLALVLFPGLRGAAPDFDAAHVELTATLKDFLRIVTVNPPGNETPAAKFFQEILQRDGIAAEILEKEASRGSVVARLKGSGRKRPLLLMGHLDTVPVEREKWSVDPFAAVEKD